MTVVNGTTGIDKVQDGSIYPEDLVQKMTLMTAQTASGTSVDFTGIPSWVNKITLLLSGISTNGTDNLLIQIGHLGGIETTGYLSGSYAGGVESSFLTGFSIRQVVAGDTGQYVVTITKVTSNMYVSGHTGFRSNTNVSVYGGGSKTLAGTLDRVRITTANGTNTFDAGTINIMYEG